MLIYSLGLREISIVLGLLYLAKSLIFLIKPFYFQDLLQKFPRSVIAGYALTFITTIWAASLLSLIDLGEYNRLRTTFVALTLVGGVLSCFYVIDFLSIRSLGILLLLGANVILDGAFLLDNRWKIVLVTNAYFWIVLGIVMVSTPYHFRNFIQWVTDSLRRWQILNGLGVLLGFFILGLGIFSF